MKKLLVFLFRCMSIAGGAACGQAILGLCPFDGTLVVSHPHDRPSAAANIQQSGLRCSVIAILHLLSAATELLLPPASMHRTTYSAQATASSLNKRKSNKLGHFS